MLNRKIKHYKLSTAPRFTDRILMVLRLATDLGTE